MKQISPNFQDEGKWQFVWLVRSFLFSTLLIAAFFTPNLSPAQGSNLDFGKKYFEGKCARCHGKDGAGNPKMTHLLDISLDKINLHRDEVRRMSVIQIEAMIDSGKHRMPKYRGKLTDNQIHDIASYVNQLSKIEIPKSGKTQK